MFLCEKAIAQCESFYTKRNPFYISHATKQGDKVFENLRSLSDISQVSSYLPKESIIFDLSNLGFEKEGLYLPVEVMALPSLVREKRIRDSRQQIQELLSGANKRAELNEQGYLHQSSLREAKDYHYAIRDQEIFGISLEDSDLLTVKFAIQKDRYKRDCHEQGYFLEVTIKKPSEDIDAGEFFFDFTSEEGKKLIESLIPLPEHSSQVLFRIMQYIQMDQDFYGYQQGDLEYLETLDLFKFPFDEETLEAPYNTYYYNPDNDGYDDMYIKLLGGCALLSVLKKYNEEFGDGENSIAIGDMYHPKEWGDHKTHGSGYCIDIRPVRWDGEQGRITYKDSEEGYSRTRTKNLMNLLADAGAKVLYFNDPKILREIPKAQHKGGHHNHIHVEFGDTERVRRTCFSGL